MSWPKEPSRLHITGTTPCPWCGRPNYAHTEADPGKAKPPEVGDLSICWGCHQIAIFTAGGVLRRPTLAEQAEADNDAVVQTALQALRDRADDGPMRAAAEARRRVGE